MRGLPSVSQISQRQQKNNPVEHLSLSCNFLEKKSNLSEFLRWGLVCNILWVIFQPIILIFIIVSCNTMFWLLYPLSFLRCPLFIWA